MPFTKELTIQHDLAMMNSLKIHIKAIYFLKYFS